MMKWMSIVVIGFLAVVAEAQAARTPLSCEIFISETPRDQTGFYNLPFTSPVPARNNSKDFYFDTESGRTKEITKKKFEKNLFVRAPHLIHVRISNTADKIVVLDLTFHSEMDENGEFEAFETKAMAPLFRGVSHTYHDGVNLRDVIVGTFVNAQLTAPKMHGYVSCQQVLDEDYLSK